MIKACAVLVLFLSQVAQADQFDVPSLCDSSANELTNEFLSQRLDIDETLFANPPEVIATHISYQTADLEAIPWRMQNPTQPNLLKAAHLLQLSLAQSLIDNFEPGLSPRKLLERAAQVKAHYSPAALLHARLVMQSVANSDPAEEMEPVKQNAGALCASYLNFGCANALKEALKLVDTRLVGNEYIWSNGSLSVSQPASLSAILSDPSLVQGISYFATRLMDKLELGRPIGRNLFDDLKESFVHFGSSTSQAEEQTFTVLAFYSTRGATLSMFDGAANSENLPVWVALQVISTAIGIIDSESAASGHAYSFPNEVRGRCRMDRPYHFWMSASLVHSLVKLGHSPKSAVLAVHILGNLYEFGAKVTGRTNSRIYTDKFMSSYPLMVQIGIAHKTMGSLWASNLKTKPLNIDDALSTMFTEARAMPSVTEKEINDADVLKLWMWFKRVIAPDAALESIGPF